MPATVVGIHLGPGNHASRPAANAAGQPHGAVYSCTDHGLIYISDGSTWTTYATLGGGSPAAEDVSFDPSGLAIISGTDVQAALEELDAEVDGLSGGGFTAPVTPGRILYTPAGTYTTSSDTFADIDGTNLSITKVLTGSRYVRLTIACTVDVSVATAAIGWDFTVDGTRDIGGTYGIPFNHGDTAKGPFCLSYITASPVAAGSRVFRPQWRKIGAATATISGTGVYSVLFTVEELPS